jgi:hypothetical protein
MNDPNEKINLAIFNTEGVLLNDHQMKVFRHCYQPQRLSQFQMPYDQLVYQLIFWIGGCGCGCGIRQSEKASSATALIQKL